MNHDGPLWDGLPVLYCTLGPQLRDLVSGIKRDRGLKLDIHRDIQPLCSLRKFHQYCLNTFWDMEPNNWGKKRGNSPWEFPCENSPTQKEINLRPHISKSILAMLMKLSETTEGLHVSEYIKFQTSISFLKSDTGSQSWAPRTQYNRPRWFPPFLRLHISKSI